MVLFRALNDLDIASNPTENGIASKQIIYKIVKNYYEKNNIEEYRKLNDIEKDLFIKEHMKDYLENNNRKIKNKYYKLSNQSRKDIEEFSKLIRVLKPKTKDEINEFVINNNDNLDFGSYIKFYNYLSSLQTHLLYGSSKLTDWISTSTSFDSIKRYYENQDIHKIALIKSNTGGLVDSDNILSVDLSTMDKIKDKKYLCNKININNEKVIEIISEICKIDPTLSLKFQNAYVNKTDTNSRGFKYAVNSSEVCILKYIPSDHIISILESLQIDLIRARLFNFDYLKLNKEEQKQELERLKRGLEFEIHVLNDPFLKHVFNELYLNNKNINSIVNFHDSREKVIHNRNKIIKLASNAYNIQIKR